MIPWYKPHFWGDEIEMVTDALKSTWISDGEYVVKFEFVLSDILGAKHVITTSNGTTSLMLAYLAMGIGPGDEIIIPGFTFAAPANMALAIGATPVFADIDRDTWLLCPKSVEQNITKKTKAIVPVHTYGNICDMHALTKIAKKHNLYMIEDVAEAAFSTYKNKQAGTFGDFGCFSFQATKTITTGEGGAVCTNKADLQDTARLIRNHGMRSDKRYWHEVVGHNFRLTNLQSALGVAQLENINEIIENKERVYERYTNNLNGQCGITLQKITPDCIPVMWAIVVKVDEDVIGKTRDDVGLQMRNSDIETRPGFYPFSDMPIYDTYPLPNSTEISRHVISLPSYTMISDNDIDFICDTFLTVCAV